VEVALVNEIAASITPLLDESAAPADLERATTAIFYSISNTQTGLARRELWRLAHQARGGKPARGVSAPQDLCHALAHAGSARLAGQERASELLQAWEGAAELGRESALRCARP
jgi:malonyl-CoA decarboxylase